MSESQPENEAFETAEEKNGSAAVARFVRVVAGAAAMTANDIDGDVRVPFNGGTHAIEVKQATTGGQVYQVRAIRFLPCAILDVREDGWYVISATRLVRMMARYERGQHTQVSFESRQITLSKALKKELVDWRCTDDALSAKVGAALAEDDGQGELLALMTELGARLLALQKEYVGHVTKLG